VLAEARDTPLLKYFAKCLTLMFANVANVSLSLSKGLLFIKAKRG